MYAIIQDGGHQYRVEQGQKIRVQARPVVTGDTIVFDRVCLVGGGEGPRIGQPFVDGARVEGRVTCADVGGEKVYPAFYRVRKHSRRRRGHRQHYTEVQITSIAG
jgi:large subunit ribosomal protein L21